MSRRSSANADLYELVSLFYDAPGDLGEFHRVTGEQLPPSFARLLDHHHHMTVTVESIFQQPVDVRVLQAEREGNSYWRKILLLGQRDHRNLQFGIVRLDLDVLADDVRDEIIDGGTPLGRVLVSHNVLREVERLALWRVAMSAELAHFFQVSGGITYGRTALIYCEGEPAIELLEIVTPRVDEPASTELI